MSAVLNITKTYYVSQVLCSQKLEGRMVESCFTHNVIVILHNFRFMSYEPSVMDVNLAVFAFYLFGCSLYIYICNCFNWIKNNTNNTRQCSYTLS